MTNPITETK